MDLLYILDLIGTVAFAASGALAGIRRKMDIFGVVVLGVVTATGGGTLRDILLGDTPPFILQNEIYLYLSVAASLAMFVLYNRLQFLESSLILFDAIGLGTFVVIGTGKALAFKVGFAGCIMAGVMTATTGGMIRDVLSNRIPMVLQKEVYASACLAGGMLMVLLHYAGVPEVIYLVTTATTVTIIRLMAVRYQWSLPRAGGVN